MEYRTTGNQVIVSLPITGHKTKVRVKRPVAGHAADPVASRRVPLAQTDYLEWQISYYTESRNAPSVLPDVVLEKAKGTRYGYELVRLLAESRSRRILSKTRFAELCQLIATPLDAGIEELERIRMVDDLQPNTIVTQFGFARHYLHVPNYFRVADSYSVEIKIAPKQKAVGNQAMIFVNLPLAYCQSKTGAPLVGRCATTLEKVDYIIDASNVGVIFDTIVAFAMASVAHRNDLRMIFTKL